MDSAVMRVDRCPDDEAYNSVIADARSRLDRGDDLDDVLTFLRSRGWSFIPCVRAVVDLTEVGLGEAKNTVHSSKAFADERPNRETFWADAASAIEQELSNEN